MTGRLLGVDYGTVRVGLAISDSERRLASPLATYQRRSMDEDAAFFRRLAEAEEVAGIVLGLPLHCDGREGHKAVESRAFGDFLAKATGLPTFFWDERFSTIEAENYLLEAGLTKKKRQARRDRVAAQIFLQAFLDAGCPEHMEPRPL